MESALTRAWNGDEEALSEVLCAHYDRLAVKIKQQIPADLRQTFSEEDVLQDCLISVFQSFKSLRQCSEPAFIAWLDSIVKNQLIDSIRKARAKRRGGDVRRVGKVKRPSTGSIVQAVTLLFGNELTPSRNVARDEATEALMVAIRALPDDQREAVERRFLSGEDLAEVADTMGRSPDSVRNLLYRAKEKLRQQMRASILWTTRG